MQLSVVTTLYRSSGTVEQFHTRVAAVAEACADEIEFIYVDDGSPDDSGDRVLELMGADSRIRLVELSRNFGHHKAAMTGLQHARGDRVFLIDCDLEEDPGLLGQFCDEMKRSSVDVVFGVQAGARRGGILERTTGDLFYRLFNVLSTIQIPRNILTIRLMTRPYVNALTSLGDREMYMAGLMSFAGFRQLGVPVDKDSKGTSSYSIPRRLALLVNAVTSFSNKPLRWIFYLGVGVLILSGFAVGLLLLRKAMGGTLEGWVSVMVSVWIFGGLILFCLGIVGIYLGKVHAEVKRRPLTVVRRVYQAQGSECGATGMDATASPGGEVGVR